MGSGSGVSPAQDSSISIIAGVGEVADAKRAQKAAAEDASVKAGRRVIERIYNSFLENIYNKKKKDKDRFELTELLGKIALDVDETALYGGYSGDQGEMYAEAMQLYKEDKYIEAFNIFIRLALTGYSLSINIIGEMYRLGQGVDFNPQEAVKWYRKGMKLGDEKSEYSLALCYVGGFEVSRDYELGIEILEGLAEEGYLRALNELAAVYSNAKGVEKDFDRAFELCREAIISYDNEAKVLMGQIYEKGYGVNVDNKEALLWFKGCC